VFFVYAGCMRMACTAMQDYAIHSLGIRANWLRQSPYWPPRQNGRRMLIWFFPREGIVSEAISGWIGKFAKSQVFISRPFFGI